MHREQKVFGTRFGVRRVSMLRVVNIVLGTYFEFGYLDP